MKHYVQLYFAVLLSWLGSLLICATYFVGLHVNLYLVGILFLNAGMLMTHPAYYSALAEIPHFDRWRRWQWLALFLSLLPVALWAADSSIALIQRLIA